MFPDDPIKEIIKELHPSLGRIVHPQDNDGLIEFDSQQIAAIENDKLFEILGRRTTRSFALFAIHLCDSNPELVEGIIQYTQEHVQQIHRSIQNYEKEQSLPSVTVGPSLVTNSSSNDLVQGCRATEILLEDVPNRIFRKWTAELNNDYQWSKLADIMELSRKKFKELAVKSNPGEEILDILSEKPDFTVQRLVYLLECAELTTVLHTIRQTLEPVTLMYKDTDKTTLKIQTTNDDYGLQIKNSTRHTTTATTINATKEIPVDDMQQENPSYDSIKSTCDDEEVQQTEHLVKGAEGVVINKINKLNTTHLKIDRVNHVHIYLGNEIEKTETLEETDAEADLLNQEMSKENTTPPHLSTKRGNPKFASEKCNNKKPDYIVFNEKVL